MARYYWCLDSEGASNNERHRREDCSALPVWRHTAGKRSCLRQQARHNERIELRRSFDGQQSRSLAPLVATEWNVPSLLGRLRTDRGHSLEHWIVLPTLGQWTPWTPPSERHSLTRFACHSLGSIEAQSGSFFRTRSTARFQGNPYWRAASRGCCKRQRYLRPERPTSEEAGHALPR